MPFRKLWHFAGSKRRCLLMASKDDEMFMTRSFNVTPKTTEQHLTARSDKSVAYVTNNKRLCSMFYTVKTNYWQTQSIAWPLCDSRATCFYLGLTKFYKIWIIYSWVHCGHNCSCISNDAECRCWQPLDIEQHNTQSRRTYDLKVQVGIAGGVLPGFVTGIHRDSIRRWNLWFPSAGVFTEVLEGSATWM